jgi:hypothetical protein
LGCPISNISKVVAADSSGDDGGGSDSNDGSSDSSSPNKDEDTSDGGEQEGGDNDDGTQTGSSDNGNNLPDDSNTLFQLKIPALTSKFNVFPESTLTRTQTSVYRIRLSNNRFKALWYQIQVKNALKEPIWIPKQSIASKMSLFLPADLTSYDLSY